MIAVRACMSGTFLTTFREDGTLNTTKPAKPAGTGLSRFFTKELALRTVACIIGNIIIGLGVAMAKIADLGIDPFNGMCMSVSAYWDVPYTTFTLCFNLSCFVFEIIWGRKYINIGTFINWFLICYDVSFFLWLFGGLFPAPESLAARIILLVGALFVMSFGLAVYQMADLGVSPYDVLPIMFCDRVTKFPYFWARIIVDSLCVTGMLLSKSDLIGIGTLLTALGLGPIIHLFTVLLTRVMKLKQKEKSAA